MACKGSGVVITLSSQWSGVANGCGRSFFGLKMPLRLG
jgi:hypothetical protein